MEARRLILGESRSPVVVVDGIGGDPAAITKLAAALAPFPALAGTYYPGLRRMLDERDGGAWAYVGDLLEAAAPFIAGGFEVDGFDLLEASFSLVTTPPDRLSPPQRAPHFDSPDPDHLAVMHYIGGVEGSGTAFFRQRDTGIETVTAANLPRFVAAARAEAATRPAAYVAGSDAGFEEIGRVDAIPGRVAIYSGQLLHSGIIPPAMRFSDDPRTGRLTTNIFVRGRRG